MKVKEIRKAHRLFREWAIKKDVETISTFSDLNQKFFSCTVIKNSICYFLFTRGEKDSLILLSIGSQTYYFKSIEEFADFLNKL